MVRLFHGSVPIAELAGGESDKCLEVGKEALEKVFLALDGGDVAFNEIMEESWDFSLSFSAGVGRGDVKLEEVSGEAIPRFATRLESRLDATAVSEEATQLVSGQLGVPQGLCEGLYATAFDQLGAKIAFVIEVSALEVVGPEGVECGFAPVVRLLLPAGGIATTVVAVSEALRGTI
jgi:hypothetical protein